MRRITLLCVVIAIGAPCSGAQAADPATKELVEKLLARIDSLEKRVAELEKGSATASANAPQAAASPAPAPAKAPSAALAMHQSHDQAPAPQTAGPESAPVYPSLKIAGFSDLDFSATNLHTSSAGFGAQTLLQPHSG